MRLRRAAPPAFLVTVKPKRGGPASDSPLRRAACKLNANSFARRPFAVRTKSALFLRRAGGRCVGRLSVSLPAFRGSRMAVSEAGARPMILREMGWDMKAKLRPTASCGRAPGGRRPPCGRQRSPCGHESRDGACAPACSVDKSASPECSVRNLGAAPKASTQSHVTSVRAAGGDGTKAGRHGLKTVRLIGAEASESQFYAALGTGRDRPLSLGNRGQCRASARCGSASRSKSDRRRSWQLLGRSRRSPGRTLR